MYRKFRLFTYTEPAKRFCFIIPCPFCMNIPNIHVFYLKKTTNVKNFFCLENIFLTKPYKALSHTRNMTDLSYIEYHLPHAILVTCLYNSSSVMESNPYIDPITCTLLLPLPVFTTCTCAGIRSIISATWEITPTLTPLHLQPLQSIHRNAQSVHIQRPKPTS